MSAAEILAAAGVTAEDIAKAQADAHVLITAAKALVDVVKHLCGGDAAMMVPALMGAIIVVAADRPQPVAVIAMAITGLEDACGPHGDHIRAAVREAVLNANRSVPS